MKNLAYLLACALLAGCSTLPYRPPQFMEPGARFPGLVDFVAAAPGRRADLLLVHGMCSHGVDWADQTVATLRQAIGANAARAEAQAAAQQSVAPGVVLVSRSIALPQGELRVRALIWSSLTDAFKRQLDYDHSDRLPVQRAKLNGALKDTLLDDCIPDALAYQGVARDSIQRHMLRAIEQATADAPASTPLVVLSSSLGSKILFDTLLRMDAAAQPTIDRMRYLVMAANQIPLLSVADQDVPGPQAAAGAKAAAPDSLQALLRKRRAPATPRAGASLVLVAFSDPNDLLSYTLPPERYAGPGIEVFNVLVSNAPTWFGLLERPDHAHRNYLLNPDVARIAACGQPRSSHCE